MYMNSDLTLPTTSSGTINNMGTIEESFFEFAFNVEKQLVFAAVKRQPFLIQQLLHIWQTQYCSHETDCVEYI